MSFENQIGSLLIYAKIYITRIDSLKVNMINERWMSGSKKRESKYLN